MSDFHYSDENHLQAFKEHYIEGKIEKNVDYGLCWRLGIAIGKWLSKNGLEGHSVSICSEDNYYTVGYKVALRRGLCSYAEICDVGEGDINLLGFSMAALATPVGIFLSVTEGENCKIQIFKGATEINKEELAYINLNFRTIGSLYQETLRQKYPHGNVPMKEKYLAAKASGQYIV